MESYFLIKMEDNFGPLRSGEIYKVYENGNIWHVFLTSFAKCDVLITDSKDIPCDLISPLPITEEKVLDTLTGNKFYVECSLFDTSNLNSQALVHYYEEDLRKLLRSFKSNINNNFYEMFLILYEIYSTYTYEGFEAIQEMSKNDDFDLFNPNDRIGAFLLGVSTMLMYEQNINISGEDLIKKYDDFVNAIKRGDNEILIPSFFEYARTLAKLSSDNIKKKTKLKTNKKYTA